MKSKSFTLIYINQPVHKNPNMKDSVREEDLNPDQDSFLEAIKIMHQDLNSQLNLIEQEDQNETVHDEHEQEEEKEEEEFSFMSGEAITSPVAAEDAFVNGHIKPAFLLFNPDLLHSGEESHEALPMKPPALIQKKFERTNEPSTSSSGRGIGGTARPFFETSHQKDQMQATPDIRKKSKSTGFSKIQRFKDFLRRSNSDGSDPFAFMNYSHTPPRTMATSGKTEKKDSGKSKTAAALSPLEVYLKRKAKHDEQRRFSLYR